ncbi:MAG: hypothetical protein K2J14_03310 [Treponemataceae bacterium]|nr:hypothetical protein [Treponemataceae bacterium]
MTTSTSRTVQGIIGGVFALAVIYFVAGFVVDKKTGPVKAQERFDAFAYETRNLAATYEPTSDAFRTAIAPVLTEHIGGFTALQLYVNNQLVFDYQAAQADENTTAARMTEYAKTLFGNNLEISGVVLMGSPQAAVAHAKISFALILLGTVTAIVLLLITPQKSAKATNRPDDLVVEPYEDDDEEAPGQPEDDADSYDTADDNDTADWQTERAMPVNETARAAGENDDEQTIDDNRTFFPPASEAAFAVSSDEKNDVSPMYDATDSVVPPAAPAYDAPTDFDPIGEMEEDNRLNAEEQSPADDKTDSPAQTGITTTESDRDSSEPDALTIALENELVDAIANGQDLATLVIQLHGVTADSTPVTQLKKLLTNRLGKQGIIGDHNAALALIIKNTTLDTAIAFAQSLNNAILVILQRSGQRAQTAIGISARAFRMINADRLLTEAEQAALHADDENPVIAFRANPEKYKEYLQEV